MVQKAASLGLIFINFLQKVFEYGDKLSPGTATIVASVDEPLTYGTAIKHCGMYPSDIINLPAAVLTACEV